MNRLTRIANKCGTDKGTEHGVANGYTEIYENYFSKFDSPVIAEIGILNGDSIRMLNDYFDGDCKIYACDIDDACGETVKDMENVTFVHVDASNTGSLSNLAKVLNDNGGADIIIDDASHVWSHIMKTLYCLHSCVKGNGIYIVEDIHLGLVKQWKDEYNEGHLNEDSPLLYFLLPQSNPYLTKEENLELREHIETAVIYSHKNNKQDWTKCGDGRCITSILTFN